MAVENSGKKAIKAGIGYTAGNIMVKGISFISIPIFARILTVSDYGIVNTFNAYTSIFFVIIGFSLHASIKNAKIDYKRQLNEYCSSVVLLTVYNTVLLLAVSIVLGKVISGTLSLEKQFIPVLIVVSSSGMALMTYYCSVLSADYRYREYLTLSLLYAVLGVGLSVALVLFAFPQERWIGRISGIIIADIFASIYILYRLFSTSKPKNKPEYWKYGLGISLPIVPHGLSQILLSQFDRLMINNIYGSAETGRYSFAYNIGIIFQVVANSTDTAWSQWFFDRMENNGEQKIAVVSDVYGLIMSFSAVCLMLVSPEVVLLLGGEKYRESVSVTPPIVLAMFFSFMYYFPAAIEYYHKKTNMIAVGTVSAALLNIAMNFIFIPRYGYVAAAYTTVVCYVLYYFFHVIISRKVHGSYVYNMKTHIGMAALVVLFAAFCVFFIDFVFLRYSMLVLLISAASILAVKKRKLIKNFIEDFRK